MGEISEVHAQTSGPLFFALCYEEETTLVRLHLDREQVGVLVGLMTRWLRAGALAAEQKQEEEDGGG